MIRCRDPLTENQRQRGTTKPAKFGELRVTAKASAFPPGFLHRGFLNDQKPVGDQLVCRGFRWDFRPLPASCPRKTLRLPRYRGERGQPESPPFPLPFAGKLSPGRPPGACRERLPPQPWRGLHRRARQVRPHCLSARPSSEVSPSSRSQMRDPLDSFRQIFKRCGKSPGCWLRHNSRRPTRTKHLLHVAGLFQLPHRQRELEHPLIQIEFPHFRDSG